MAANAWAQEEPTDLIVNGDFSDGSTGWWASVEGAVADGEWCLDVPGGTINPWDAMLSQAGLPLTEGESYELRFTARSSEPIGARVLVERRVEPYPVVLDENPILYPEAATFSHRFTASETAADWQLAFQFGGNETPWQFCLSDVQLLTGAEPPAYEPDTGPRVRVNQVAYLPEGPKEATLVTDATEPVAWELADAEGSVVATGRSTVYGDEPTSGTSVHTIDFSAVTATGEGFTLTADGETSYPFDIGAGDYQALAVDALSFYYPQRSGIAIDDAIAPGYGRAAGHVDVAPNQGDGAVPCWEDACDYTLDVTGGWYDAGDHGKYVVNGGISVAQVMGVYERALHAPTGDTERLADGTLRLPEHGNDVPDVLDEARWEMEWLMKMQVPAGEALAGMAHHKMGDESWTGLPLLPDRDPVARFLAPPATAATLNLAASAAQCARLFEPFDADFAAQCLTAAETAWDAAQAHPDILAEGGPAGTGGYGDSVLQDEFYWAAAELFLTTGDAAYEDFVLASPMHTADVFGSGSFDWQNVGPLARLQLAAVPSGLSDRDRVIQSVTDGADEVLAAQQASPWDLTFGNDGGFWWGSNGLVLNNAVVMGVAHDLTGEERFRDGVFAAFDYILGRNAMGNSYVTGYGSHYSQNQHSRWYAASIDPDLPHPPPGTLAGGPNSDEAGEAGDLAGCAPQRCYIDEIGSYTTNELTINWNAPLSWVANFVADETDGEAEPDPDPVSSCEVDYQIQSQWPGGFVAKVVVANIGDEPLHDPTIQWEAPVGQAVTYHWNAELTRDGQSVTATLPGWAQTLAPGAEFSFGFIGAVNGEALEPDSISCSAG